MKLAILDRIGTLHPEGEDAVVGARDWQPQAGVLDAIAQLNRAGWHVVVATNQPGLGRGNFDVNELNAVHQRMQRELATAASPRRVCCSRLPSATGPSRMKYG